MSALMEVVTLWHENSCDQGVVDLAESMKELLTKKDVDWFQRMCEKGIHVDSDEYDLYKDSYEHVVNGETQVVEVSIGITSEERSWEDEATGWGSFIIGMWAALFFICFIRCLRVCYLFGVSLGTGERVFQRVRGESLFSFACS
jgi:hypothetical protein